MYIVLSPLIMLIHLLLLGTFLKIPMHVIIFFVNEESFTSSFTISMPLISLSCHIALARTAYKMSNGNGNDGHLCFVLYLKGKAFSLSSLNMTLGIGFHIRTLLDLGRSFLFLFCWEFLFSLWIGVEFCQMQMLFYNWYLVLYLYSVSINF